jgi:hypothetical protein
MLAALVDGLLILIPDLDGRVLVVGTAVHAEVETETVVAVPLSLIGASVTSGAAITGE